MPLQQMLAQLDGNRAFEHVRWLTQNVPNRQSGSDREHRAAEYFVDQLKSWGVPVEVHEFPGYVSWPGECRIEVLGPEPRTIEANTFAHAGSTAKEGVEAELIYLGHGGEEDYVGKDVAGKIVVTVISYSPPRPEKVRLAQAHGAAGIIMHNFTAGNADLLPEGTCKPMWGNPTDEDIHKMPQIPAVGIRYSDGEWIQQQLQKGPVRIRLQAQAARLWRKLMLPVAYLEGKTEPDRFTVFGGHYDSWSKGATDNASGSACTLEMARVLSQHRNSLHRSVMFTFWPGHEQGIMEGSTWFVDTFWSRLKADCLAYLNVDSTGMAETGPFLTTASPVLADFSRRIVREMLGQDHDPLPVAKTGDQSFFGVGVPSVYGRQYPDEETLKRWGGVSLGWWWHSSADTEDKVDPKRLGDALRAYAGFIDGLSNSPVIPYRFAALANQFGVRVAELQERSKGRFPLDGLQKQAANLSALAANFDRRTAELESNGASFQDCHDHNRAALAAARELIPAAGQVAPPWQQDSYGLSDLKTFIPVLRGVEDLGNLDPADGQFQLKANRLLRVRNRIADHLNLAMGALDSGS